MSLGGMGFILVLGGRGGHICFGGKQRKASDSYHLLNVTPVIVFTEPEHGPNTDLLGTSPQASLGMTAGKGGEARREWASSMCSKSLLPSHVN